MIFELECIKEKKTHYHRQQTHTWQRKDLWRLEVYLHISPHDIKHTHTHTATRLCHTHCYVASLYTHCYVASLYTHCYAALPHTHTHTSLRPDGKRFKKNCKNWFNEPL